MRNPHRRQGATRFLALLFVLILAAVGCGRSGDGAEVKAVEELREGGAVEASVVPDLKADESYEIAVLLPNAGDPYFQQKTYGYRDEAEKVGVDLTFFDAGGYANVEKQVAQIEDATQRGVDAIAIAVTSSTAVVPALEEAIDAGILVVGDGVFPESDQVIKRGEDSVVAGKNSAEYLCENLNDGDTVGALFGPPGIDLVRLREVGLKLGLAECEKDIQIVQELYPLSDIANSTDAAEDIITAHPDLDGFFTFGSVVGQGVVSALQSAGHEPGDVLVTTVDLDPDLEDMMQDGWVQQTSIAGSILLGRVVVDTIVESLNGEDVPDEAYLLPETITIDNLDKFDRSILFPPE